MSNHNAPPTPVDFELTLSSSGEQRSREILHQLQDRLARSTRRSRTARRTGAAGASLAVIAFAAWLAIPRSAPKKPEPGREVAGQPAPVKTPTIAPSPAPVEHIAAERRAVTIRVVSSAGGALARCGADSISGERASSSAPHVCVLDDRQLLSALSETSGGAYGMIRVNGQTVIMKDGKPYADHGG